METNPADRIVSSGLSLRMDCHITRRVMANMSEVPQCDFCAHEHEDQCTCDAFPLGIPHDIFLNLFDHQRPFPGDKEFPSDYGVTFMPKPGMKHPGIEEDYEDEE